LEAIELRASNWQGCDNLTAYYKAKITAEVNFQLLSPPPPLLIWDMVLFLLSKVSRCRYLSTGHLGFSKIQLLYLFFFILFMQWYAVIKVQCTTLRTHLFCEEMVLAQVK
jgi:hypothetical protein